MSEFTYKSVEFKLYLSKEQEATLNDWLGQCCWVYNKCLEQRRDAWKEHKESVGAFSQIKMLTRWRLDLDWLTAPVGFQRSAIQRVDRAFKYFFTRVRVKTKKAGYPKFKSRHRYHSMACVTVGIYVSAGKVRIPNLGKVKARGAFELVGGKQKSLHIIRRASGWYAQVLCERPKLTVKPVNNKTIGIDLGLAAFLTTSEGEKVENPRLLRKSAKKLKAAQRALSRKQKGSNRRKKAVTRVARLYERVVRQRKGFCHKVSRDLVNRFNRIAVENLQVAKMAKGRFAESINDVCWSTFLFYLSYKAENAGGEMVKVDPKYSSQECPQCGNTRKKELSERQHNCSRCHSRLDRDHAAAIVIKNRAFRPERGELLRPRLPLAAEASSKKRKAPIRGTIREH